MIGRDDECLCSWVDVSSTQSFGALKCPHSKPHKTRRKNGLEKDFEKIFLQNTITRLVLSENKIKSFGFMGTLKEGKYVILFFLNILENISLILSLNVIISFADFNSDGRLFWFLVV